MSPLNLDTYFLVYHHSGQLCPLHLQMSRLLGSPLILRLERTVSYLVNHFFTSGSLASMALLQVKWGNHLRNSLAHVLPNFFVTLGATQDADNVGKFPCQELDPRHDQWETMMPSSKYKKFSQLKNVLHVTVPSGYKSRIFKWEITSDFEYLQPMGPTWFMFLHPVPGLTIWNSVMESTDRNVILFSTPCGISILYFVVELH